MSSTPPATSDTKAKLGLWMCLALVVGNIIGSGIFLLPASLAPYGINSVIGWLMTAAGAMFLAVVFARLSRVYPQAGGPYVYPRVAFGELAGFLMAWAYWVSTWVGNAAIAIGTVASLAELIPSLKTTVGAPAVTAVALIWMLTFLNWRGVKFMGAFQLVTTVLKLLPLLAIIVLACSLFLTHDASVIKIEPQPITMSAISASAALTLWALLGLESATVPSDNVIDPQKTVPRATLWGTLIATIVYVLACTTVLLLVPGSQLAQSNAPFADALRLFWGDTAANTLALFAFISGFGALNGWILIQGEMPRVLAREGIFPRMFARESRFGTPGVALFVTSTLVTPVVLMSYADSMVAIFTKVILIATDAFLVMYLFCSLAAFKLALRGDFGLAGRTLRWFLVVAMIATAYSLWTLYGAGKEPFFYNLGLLALGLLVYFAMKLFRRDAEPSRVAASPP
jgi:APA family basic amino acid/polyamine antiporter